MRARTGLLMALILLIGGCNWGQGKTDRVMVLGIDGGIWDVMVPMMEAGELPNIKRLYDGGMHGILESRPPIISPVVWTTIFTGQRHEKTGVEDWKTSQSIHRKVEAIWNITSDAGRTTDLFNVPGSWPPEHIAGVEFSGFPLPGSTIGGNTGDVLTMTDIEKGRLSIAYRDSRDTILDHIKKLKVGEWTDWFAGDLATRPSFAGILRAKRIDKDKYYLSPLYRTDDGVQYTYPKELAAEFKKETGIDYIPEGPGWSKWKDPETPNYLAQHCTQIFDIQSRAAELFAPKDWDLYINVMTLVDRISHPYWAYANPDDYDSGLDRKFAAPYANEVRDAYKRTDEEIGRILDAAKGNFYVVLASDHGFHSSIDKSVYIGTHAFDGIYLVWGPGIKGQEGPQANIEDITPTVLYLMGLPVAKDMSGKVVEGLPKELERPVTFVDSYEKKVRPSTDEPVDKETWEQLKGLGYVEGDAPKGSKDKPDVGVVK